MTQRKVPDVVRVREIIEQLRERGCPVARIEKRIDKEEKKQKKLQMEMEAKKEK